MVYTCKNQSYKERLVALQLPTLKYRRYRGDMIEVYKILTGLYDARVVPLLERNVDCRTRGNSQKLKVGRCKYDVRKYSFCNRVVNSWNSLPETVIASASLIAFKTNLENLWKSDDFYYNYEINNLGYD